jgi:superoxide dismutase, Fe-Mn family
MKHTLPPLTYAYDALEPFIDAKTMEIHHTKHHQTYVDKLNAVLEKHPDLAEKKLEDLMKELNGLQIDEADKKAIRNHGGGHLNHSLFWTLMGKEKAQDKALVDRITTDFGSVDAFKEKFTAAATNQFGSGWAWLVDNNGKLEVYSTPNQDSPYLSGHTPLIGLDVWEHAYYLKYQNKRPDYITAWWNVLKLI